jgi:hypothetical protein
MEPNLKLTGAWSLELGARLKTFPPPTSAVLVRRRRTGLHSEKRSASRNSMQGGESADADASLFAGAIAGFPPVLRFAGPSSALCFPFVSVRVVRG